MAIISIIVATSMDGVIGKDNKLPWHLPDDLKHFKKITMGHPVLMGRKTYDSIGRPLPGRRNIVLSRSPLKIEGVEVCDDFSKALSLFKADEEVFVIGGSDLFRLALPLAEKVYLTLIHQEFEGDKTFPSFDKTKYRVLSKEHVKSPMPHDYILYQRIS